MSHQDIIRAWKDDEYRSSLGVAERALLPAHPAGLVELDDAEFDAAAVGSDWSAYCSIVTYCCTFHCPIHTPTCPQ